MTNRNSIIFKNNLITMSKKQYISPIQSFDFYLEHYHKMLRKMKLENDLKELKEATKLSLDNTIIAVLEETYYEALVVTNLEKEILWASNGFKEMTGYSKSFALGKKPTFLQGKNTSQESLSEIRQLLKAQKRFSRSIVNYRKNGEEYLCHIQVIPIYGKGKKLTHFLAMESEKKVA